ncbi:peptidoglycan-binding domain-containing protein [Hamadaea sp. NPDC050747]|uniref:peptidoglycan-binding domain-containing protein n=1 Tax=Hamadaea sp. NPDC050747 TaxID=3155789 RepID=UPI003405E6C4
MRRSIVVAVAVAVVAGAAAWASVGFGGGTPDPAATEPSRAETEQVKRETLINWVTMDGQLGFGAAQPIASTATGTVTWLAAPGTTITRGQPLVRVNDSPVVLLYGRLPMYRDLQAGVEGADVTQFETNLKALGYSGFTVDKEFSASTTTAVKRWQAAVGMPETGVVTAGQVVYAAAAVRVSQQLVRLGAASPADVLSATGTTKMVAVSVQTADAGWAVRAAPVTIELPDGATVPGKVDSIADAPESEGHGPTVTILIAVADQKTLGRLDRGTLTVRHAAQERKDVLTVPIAALLALAEGGYGIELVDGGKSTVVAVRIGLFAGGRVEVSGSGVAEGMTVRVPA